MNGSDRITKWSSRLVIQQWWIKTMMGIMSLGLWFLLVPDPLIDGYYAFITPPSDPTVLEPAPMRSQ